MTPAAHLGPATDLRLIQLDLNRQADVQEWAWLDKHERHRAHRFAFDADRHRYVIAHAALRRALGAELGLPPAALRFVLGDLGKPALAMDLACHFNLSHSQDAALIALSRQQELGVDVEVLRAVPDAHELAREVFTLAEQAELSRAADPALAFLQGWTRKEACIKAIGSGLSLAPSTFEAGLAADERCVTLTWQGRAEQVWVSSLSLVGDLVGAVAFRSGVGHMGRNHV